MFKHVGSATAGWKPEGKGARYWGRVLVAVALVLAVMHVRSIPNAQAAYNCNTNVNTSTGHCYGAVWWGGPGTSYNGLYTEFTLRQLQQGDSNANTEQWLIAPVPGGYYCPLRGTNQSVCWVEAGAKAGWLECRNAECYFWDDLRPCQNCSGGNNYYDHFVAYTQSNEYNYDVTDEIGRTSSNSFGIDLSASGSGRAWGPGNGLSSTNNVMQPYRIQIGGEVQGTGGAQIPSTDFTYNQYEDTNNYWWWQTANGTPFITYPPFTNTHWVVTPSASGVGGDWRVYCMC